MTDNYKMVFIVEGCGIACMVIIYSTLIISNFSFYNIVVNANEIMNNNDN